MLNFKNNCRFSGIKSKWKLKSNNKNVEKGKSLKRKELLITNNSRWSNKWKTMDGKMNKIKWDDQNKNLKMIQIVF